MSDELRYESRMSDSDALMWTIEKDPLLRSTITAVSLLDGPVDPDRFRDKVDRASRTIPRLRQRVVGNPYSLAPPRWEVDPNFDLGYHLRAVSAGGAAPSKPHAVPFASRRYSTVCGLLNAQRTTSPTTTSSRLASNMLKL